ncbi:zinc finger BED domain-containing protein DAYSLEEPER-like [Heracleum sosnowskyi]|uniref:Zinc finger BED domain-containing protein DAYSLEEPER-like n=1 Tax=Heracleum sosnowskyi TaxID=360622 RepID=A0AAD8H5P6_9APIA|nr:zinc finger BED domain-containing protein DAYSLEEPER-like [Heracleum sosnowskyi]
MAMPTNSSESHRADQQPNKRKKKRSIVWEYFSIAKSGTDCTRAYCNSCKKSFAYISGSKLAGTSHLKRHIKMGVCSVDRRNNEKISQLIPYAPIKTDSTAVDTIPPRRRYRGIPGPSIPFKKDTPSQSIAKMIIMHEYPLNILDDHGFVEFVRFLHPRVHMDVNSVQEECVNIYHREKQDVANMLSGILGHVNLALDLWESDQGLCYLLLTGYFVDSVWKLQKRILNVVMLPFSDSEAAFSYAVVDCLASWGLEHKIFTLTLDASFANEAVQRNLRGLLSVMNPQVLNGQLILGNCYARILSCLANDALDSMISLIKKVRDSVKYVTTYRGSEEEFIELKQRLQNPSSKRLTIDDQTKWNTTYHMLVAASELKEVFSCLDTSDPNYKDTLSVEEWKLVEILCVYLKLFFDAANVLLAPTHPTTNLFYHEVSNIQLTLAHAATSQDAFTRNLTKPLWEKFSEYWNCSCLIFAVAVVMDPRFKMKLVEFSFSRIYGEDAGTWIKVVDEGIHELFVEYIVLSLPPPTFVVEDREGMKLEMSPEDEIPAGDDLSSFDVYISDIAGSQHMKSELDQYLEEPLLPRTQEFDVLSWWKQNSQNYPTLSRMASDILCIPVSTGAPDSVFDTVTKKMDSYRCSLKPSTVEALICAKDWLQYGSSSFS